MILNEEQLRQKARELALTHTLSGGGFRAASRLISRFDRDAASLRDYAQKLQRAGEDAIRPAEEWLLDHADFIAEQMIHIRKTFRLNEARRMPVLPDSLELRTMALCEDYLEHADGLFDDDLFAAYADAYQDIAVLTIGETTMLPLILRIAVIRRLAGLVNVLRERREAGERIDRMLEPFAGTPPSPAAVKDVLDSAGETMPLSGPAIVHLIDRLSEMADYAGEVRDWLVCRLDNEQESLDRIITHEHGLQAVYEVSARHAVQSLRRLARLDWSGMFERLCHVDRILREEAAGTYPLLDVSSRQVLLGRVQVLARRMRVPETLTAKQAVELANRYGADAGGAEAKGTDPEGAEADSVRADSGRDSAAARDVLLPRPSYAAYYLLDPRGVRALWRALKLCAKPRSMPRSALKQRRTAAYFGALAGTFAVLLALAVWAIAPAWGASGGQAALAALAAALLVFPASEWAVQIVHQSICLYCDPRPLLRYDFASGIPDDAAAMIVMPVIWSRPEQVRESAERLELHYLANRDPNLHFALLGDFADADDETKEGDAAIIEEAARAVEALNRAYGTEGGTTFHAYIRRRTWNEAEGVWMGWERKRGKLVEFADLLRGESDTAYALRAGDASVLPGIRYLITLDADTMLPIGAAQRMVGSIHYPYNRPRLNAAGTRVEEGYGVLQPRIGVSHDTAMRSRFARLWSGEPGIDPYAFAMSDPYQSGLDVGIFTGKGILDIDSFRAVLRERIPDNRVLSHDLLEGGFLRSGLLSDIELVDGHPATFSAYQHRQHRWIRGDWQLLGWLRRSAADRAGMRRPVDLTILTRWQIIDNMRRSLLPPALLALLAVALFLPAGPGAAAAVIALATLAMPLWRAFAAPGRLIRRPAVIGIAAGQTLSAIVTLPYQAVMTVDAVGRALYRMAVSRRKLLEWISSAEVERRNPRRLMGIGWGLALTIAYAAAAVIYAPPAMTAFGIVLAVLWAAAPAVINWLDRPVPSGSNELTAGEQEELRRLAADIWRFYEDYATERDNWLPPDNVQIDPPIGVARRTSPTNIGMLLACTVTARDFGFIDTAGMIERLERTITTVERMDKWHGHLYNWYDTETLHPLPPQYVSTVDSGNLIGCLIAAKEGLAEWIRRDLTSLQTEEPAGRREPADVRSRREAAAVLRSPGKLQPLTADLEASIELSDPPDTVRNAEPGGESDSAGDLAARGRRLIERMEALINGTDFRPLYDPASKLFSLGYHAASGEREAILYDLLASEARQASFVAIALGQVPVSHWFKLGRAMTRTGGGKALVSWSGTMFEYLMPALIMRTYAGTVWDATYRAVIRKQTEYARLRGVPMGISESGYYAFDHQMNYQYRAFGVPGLGFKRGLETDLVVSPYATALAMLFAPRTAMDELRKMESLGARGEYGFYEAVDCTRERLPDGKTSIVIRSFMAHHQGMMMLALGNLLLPTSMVDRFHADKRVRSAELLLQERMPERPALVMHAASAPLAMQDPDQRSRAPQREYRTPHPPVPEVCVLSNGSFTSVITASGAGYMNCDGIAVSRWREDAVIDPWGSGVYIRDVQRDAVWSAAWHPSGAAGEEYSAQFSLEQARFRRRDGDIRTKMDICVAPEGHAEIRRIAISNHGDEACLLEATTYVELSLAEPAADAAHPAFSKLFVETAFDEEREALLARRRMRSGEQRPVWAVHGLIPCGETNGPVEYETDRARFIGRGRTLREPESIRTRLSGTVGAVIDPMFAVRRRITVPPGGQVKLLVVTGVAASREEALELYGKFSTAQQVERIFQLAWTRSRIELHHLHMTTAEAVLAHALAGRVLYAPPLQAERAAALAANSLGQSGLWPLGISGDLPVVLVLAHQAADAGAAAGLIRCHELLRRSGIVFDLVFLIEAPGGYQQEFRDQLKRLIEQSVPRMYDERPGRVFALNADQLQDEERQLLTAVARIILRTDSTSLRAQLRMASSPDRTAVPLLPNAGPAVLAADEAARTGDAGMRTDAAELTDAAGITDAAGLTGRAEPRLDAGHAERSAPRHGVGSAGETVPRVGAGSAGRSELQHGAGSAGGLASQHDAGSAGGLASQHGAGSADRLESQHGAGTGPTDPEDSNPASGLMTESGLPHDVREGIVLWNGWGGFTADGTEYRIVLPQGKHLPAPWSNVAANPHFGFLVTERGTGYTWFRNSREFKLTPWSNDPVLDPPGEACYLRDEESGQFWSIAPAPAGGPGTAVVSHGRGYSRFERQSSGILQTMTLFTSPEDPVKVTEIRLVNTSGRRRRLSVTYYAEWVLGVKREDTAPFIETEWDGAALYARNVYQDTFRRETAFLTLLADDGNTGPVNFTADRREFIGRGGSLAEPAAMGRRTLSGAAGRFTDSCGAVQLATELEPGAERTVYVLLGCGRDADEARKLADVYADIEKCREAYRGTVSFWSETLGQFRVTTPDPAMNMLLNGWLLYQTLSCRMWARSAFYQSGGAYGFRDQLQDALALLHTRPDLTRRQILLHASHQYKEGDVQHWWHEETGRGIRTRYSDDLLWLPYVTARYIAHTGDMSVLDETQPFLVSEELREGEHERYEQTVISDEIGTIYEHCLRAIGRALRFGQHGLPLIGIGDWNDGMNNVGSEGRGESVWLGWFLVTVLDQFSALCEQRGDRERAADFRRTRESLISALNEHGWDGEWYRRASTDAGDWLGTNTGRECRIDAIAQSWSVISGGAPPERAARAMQSFDRELVDRTVSVAQLLTPPFDTTDPSPGYIQSYPPGIRENGGQYTHGVIWSIVAWALLRNGDKAFDLFDLMNPIRHTASPGDIRVYLGEPYAMAADVYMSNPYRGRAGWTLYTGAAGWMYQAGMEWILGIRKIGGRLLLDPNIPADWPGYSAEYRYGGTVYAIEVRNRQHGRSSESVLMIDGEPAIQGSAETVDGKPAATGMSAYTIGLGPASETPASGGWYIDLVDDGKRHEVVLQL